MDDTLRKQLVGYLPRLRRFARALAGSAEDGDDLLQDACLRALSRAEQWQPGTRLDSWMYRIIQTVWIDRCRRLGRREVGLVEAEDLPAPEASADDRLHLDAVRRAIGRLPEDQRTVVLLVCVEGLSYAETAATVGAPLGTVMSRLSRARRALHVMLGPQDDGVPTPTTGSQRNGDE